MARRNTHGFTLVELLVVISIIGMLMALLLPAINSVRENARRTQCSNNIRQIALGAFNYAGSKNSFPGYRGNRAGSGSTQAGMDASWFVAILPQLERSDIKDRYDQLVANPMMIPYIDFAACPSDPPEQLTPLPNAPPISHLAYVANTGRQDNPPDTSAQNFAGPAPDKEANGVFHDMRYLKSPKVTTSMKDGITNTLMLTENIQATRWTSVTEAEVGFIFYANPRSFDTQTGDLKPTANLPRINEQRASTALLPRPSSNHPGGVNVAFCDGRTMFLREDIPYYVLTQLMTPDSNNSDVPAVTPAGYPKQYLLNSADYTTQ
jgi:prepilin-type N-terminal cleavage/methylation domain-containing protein/prepilin-type processing-associated H-X9-DG protein